jgi:hypothetical protein
VEGSLRRLRRRLFFGASADCQQCGREVGVLRIDNSPERSRGATGGTHALARL